MRRALIRDVVLKLLSPIFALFMLSICTLDVSAQRGVFMTVDEFRQHSFGSQELPWQTLWVKGEQRQVMESILNHRMNGLRVRYWGQGTRTAWIFEEIGKELPITIGVIVEADQIADIKVLEYREVRGGEVRHSFFTKQFKGLQLKAGDDYRLNGKVDGITGATLSVRAMKKVATLALFCHQQSPYFHGQTKTAEQPL